MNYRENYDMLNELYLFFLKGASEIDAVEDCIYVYDREKQKISYHDTIDFQKRELHIFYASKEMIDSHFNFSGSYVVDLTKLNFKTGKFKNRVVMFVDFCRKNDVGLIFDTKVGHAYMRNVDAGKITYMMMSADSFIKECLTKA